MADVYGDGAGDVKVDLIAAGFCSGYVDFITKVCIFVMLDVE